MGIFKALKIYAHKIFGFRPLTSVLCVKIYLYDNSPLDPDDCNFGKPFSLHIAQYLGIHWCK